MATVNVGAMAARLGLDPSEFLEKMKGVEGFTTGSGQRIANEMKRTSREGAESLRLIDEALGIHLARPVTKIINQTFPALARGLSTVLGGSVFGAIAFAGVEAFSKLSEKINKAQEAQEAFRVASEAVGSTLEKIGDSWTQKIAALSDKKSLSNIISEGASEARKQLEELGKAVDDLNKKGEAANSHWTRFASAVGDAVDQANSGGTGAIRKNRNQELELMRQGLDQALRADTNNGTHTALALVDRDLAAINAKLKENHELGPDAFTDANVYRIQNESLQAQNRFLSDYKEKIEGGREAWEKAKQAADALTESIKKQKEALEAVTKLSEDIGAGYAKFHPQANPFEKQLTEIAGLRIQAENDFQAIANSAASALEKAFAKKKLDEFEQGLDKIAAKTRIDSEIFKAQAGLPGLSTAFGAAPGVGGPGNNAVLARPQRADQAEFAAVQSDWSAAIAKASQVLDQIETPAQKYATAQKTLNDLQAKGLITSDQLKAAYVALDQEMVKEADHIHKMQEELLKLLERSGSAADGMRAFWLQTQIDAAQNGKFTFDILNQATKGFEDNLASAIVNGTRNWRQQWASLAKELEASTLKFAFAKSFAGVGNQVSKSASGSGAGGILASIFKLFAPAAGAGAGAAGPADIGSLAQEGFAGGFAGGGDVSPGQDFIAGEAGPELIRAGSAGATVTPNSKMGGDTHIHYDMRGAVVTDDLVRKADALRMVRESEDRGIARGQTMQRETTLRSRPGR